MALAIGNSDISNELWQCALNTLEQNFSKPVFEMWIKPMRFVEFREDELHLAVHSKFAREWVGTKLQAQIIEVLREILRRRAGAQSLGCRFSAPPRRDRRAFLAL